MGGGLSQKIGWSSHECSNSLWEGGAEGYREKVKVRTARSAGGGCCVWGSGSDCRRTKKRANGKSKDGQETHIIRKEEEGRT